MPEDTRMPMTEALLLAPEGDLGTRVGGLGLQERWQKGLVRAGIRAPAVRPSAIPLALAGATAPLLVADAGAVLDFDALNLLAASRAGAGEVVAFRDDVGGTVPAVLLGAEAARRMAAFREASPAPAREAASRFSASKSSTAPASATSTGVVAPASAAGIADAGTARARTPARTRPFCQRSCRPRPPTLVPRSPSGASSRASPRVVRV